MSELDPKPIPNPILARAKALGVERINLRFSGGHDEGHLDVDFEPWPDDDELARVTEEWAYETYEYSGAGDGTEYGDDISYDLVEGTVTTDSWFMRREYEGESTFPAPTWEEISG